MKFFRYKEDRLPVALIVLLFAADLLVFFYAESIWLLLLWFVFSTLGKIFVAPWNHHHQHLATFHQTFLNRLLEVVYTFHTGITTNVWVLHHNLGHHLHYLDQEKDESRWKRLDGTTMGIFEYTAMTAITGYFRSYQVGKRYPKYQKGFITMGTVNLAMLLGLIYLKPISAMFIFLLPMAIVYIGTCWTTYYHHAGLDTEDPYLASHNVVNDYYNLITGNLGYHTAHHVKQALHWSKLPELHKKIEHKIPPELISDHFPGFGGVLLRAWQKFRSSQSPQSAS